VQHPLPPTQQQQAPADVNDDTTSNIFNVAEPDQFTTGLCHTTTTKCGPVDSSNSATTAAAMPHQDLSFSSLEDDGLLSEQMADISTMDVDRSCCNYSDNEMPTEDADINSAVDSTICDNDDSDTTDASSNNAGVVATNDIATDFSLLRKYDTYLSSGMGQMKGSTAYQRDIELLRILMKAKCPVYLFDQIKACFRTTVHVSKVNLLDKSASLSRKAVLKQI
jgi:hypothetical protein